MLEVFEEAGAALGTAVATMAMMLVADLYVLGRGVAKAGDLLLEPARRTVPLSSFKSVSEKVRIVATALHDDGPVLGSAWLARQAATEPWPDPCLVRAIRGHRQDNCTPAGLTLYTGAPR